MDASAFEGANFVHDLNNPIPEELHCKYDAVVDGGTLEHVFNVPVAFANPSEAGVPVAFVRARAAGVPLARPVGPVGARDAPPGPVAKACATASPGRTSQLIEGGSGFIGPSCAGVVTGRPARSASPCAAKQSPHSPAR